MVVGKTINEKLNPQQELVQDLISIIHVFLVNFMV